MFFERANDLFVRKKLNPPASCQRLTIIEGMGDIDILIPLKFVKYIVDVKREIGPNNGFPEAV